MGISIIDTSEVSAAKNTSRKKTKATAEAPTMPTAACIDRKILGRKEKIRPTLLVERSSVLVLGSKAKIAGRISRPAKKAMLVSITATVRAEPGMLSSRLK